MTFSAPKMVHVFVKMGPREYGNRDGLLIQTITKEQNGCIGQGHSIMSPALSHHHCSTCIQAETLYLDSFFFFFQDARFIGQVCFPYSSPLSNQ